MDPYKKYLDKQAIGWSSLLKVPKALWSIGKKVPKATGKATWEATKKTGPLLYKTAPGRAFAIGTGSGVVHGLWNRGKLKEQRGNFGEDMREDLAKRVLTGKMSLEEANRTLTDINAEGDVSIDLLDIPTAEIQQGIVDSDMKKYLIAAGVLAGGIGVFATMQELLAKKKNKKEQEQHGYMGK